METLLDRAAEVSRTQLTKFRWAIGLHGFASAVVGVLILAWPGISVYALTIVFGAWMLTTGVIDFVSAASTKETDEPPPASTVSRSRSGRTRTPGRTCTSVAQRRVMSGSTIRSARLAGG